MKKINIDFFFLFYEKNQISEIYSEVYDLNNKIEKINPNYIEPDSYLKSHIYSVYFIPDYLSPIANRSFFKVLKVKQFFKGYAVFLNDFQNVNDYIKFRFKKNATNRFKKIKRLEACFSINYKMFFGNIEKEDYEFLMHRMNSMLKDRFNERNDESVQLRDWDRYCDMYYNLINKKQASLFVIYENSNPIAISLNLHYDKKFFGAIASYDIDFSKFSLGTIDIYKKLEWCFENKYDLFEMGMGDLSYKKEWSNHIYHFEHQIIYPKNSIALSIKAKIIYFKTILKELIYKLIYVHYKKMKSYFKKNDNKILSYKTFPFEEIKILHDYVKINYNDAPYSELRRLVFDFMYANIENIKNIEVYKISQNQEYVIKGNLKMQKVIFDKID